MYPRIDDYKGKRIHMAGAGGTSMHGLALMLKSLGYEVTGSDKTGSHFTERLAEAGIQVMMGQRAENVAGASLLVYSAAIKPDNPERAEAKRLGIPELERSVLLGQISEHYKTVVGVAGGHGKTTVTSMLAKIASDAKLDPTVHVGGFVDFMGGGIAIGSDEYFITEACEYVDSYLHLRPTIAVINNIDNDHLDYFRAEENIFKSFEKYAALLPDDGLLVACADDDARVAGVIESCGKPVVTFGLTKGDYTAKDIRTGGDGTTRFDMYKGGERVCEVALAVPGLHNVKNALAAYIVAVRMGVDGDSILASLAGYRLTRRRFERCGDMAGASVYHDYAHHPAEIAACLQGARSVCKGKLYAVFQCNSYTRAITLFSKDVKCFADADEVLVPEIYPGREVDTGIVHATDMVKAINGGGVKARYIKTFEEINDCLRAVVEPGDMVITLGSGDVYKQTAKLTD